MRLRLIALPALLSVVFSFHSVDTQAAPVIPGYERFFTGADTSQENAGRVLLNELSCTKCHASPDERVQGRTSPILDRVGSRAEVDYLRKYLTDAHAAKAGALMPNLFAGWMDSERKDAVEALVHLLASTGTVHQTAPNSASVMNGEKLFHQVGCVACHGVQKTGAPQLKTSVPLGDVGAKYSIQSLADFLKNPHSVRPSGRMPSLNLNDQEARDIATYFMKDVKVPANIAYQVFEGGWNEIPDFGSLKPKTTGQTTGFDLGVAGKTNNFGIRFSGFLHLEKAGEYRLTIGSDDGSWMKIDGEVVVEVNGVHPHSVKEGRRNLEAGVHEVIIDYFQGGGEWTLEAHIQGPGVPKQPLANLITLTREKPKATTEHGFKVDDALVTKGKELFSSVGCANCHQLKLDGKQLASTLKAKPLNELNSVAGCLSAQPAGKTPYFAVNQRQAYDIVTAIKSLPDSADKTTPEQQVHLTLATFNCYACHERNKIGGVEREREAAFVGTTPEMGDEGRIPPSLTGAGDKLTDQWLEHILNNGAADRPYMLTRMPKFGVNHVKPLLALFPNLDRKTETQRAEYSTPEYRVKAEGRLLVGEKGLSCIKCHPFGNNKSTGIQAINLQQMTNRLREDWFNRYMADPQAYRSGTRMPSAWPNGRSIFPAILDGDVQKQVSSVWLYLSDRDKAAIPIGVGGQMIVLEPQQSPIIYRNFIEGLTPRGIAVGYPGGINLAFDAEQMALRQIWHGAFIDAGKHWVGRGPGNQIPLGDHLVQLPSGQPFAVLESADAAWPGASSREAGYRFLGYKLNDERQPSFKYRFGNIEAEDFPLPVTSEREATFTRRIQLTADGVPMEKLYFRVAVGKIEPADDNLFLLDGILKLKITGGTPILRQSGGGSELLVPVTWTDGKAELAIEYLW